MMKNARIVAQTATLSMIFCSKLLNTVAKLIVLTGVMNPDPKPASKLLLNLTRSGVAASV